METEANEGQEYLRKWIKGVIEGAVLGRTDPATAIKSIHTRIGRERKAALISLPDILSAVEHDTMSLNPPFDREKAQRLALISNMRELF